MDAWLHDLWRASKLSKQAWEERNAALIELASRRGGLAGLGSPGGRGRQTYHYFAYGANMDADRMRRRTASAVFVKKYELAHYRLRFAGHSQTWGGRGVATIIRGDAFDYVPGVVWQMTAAELTALDRFEGTAYERQSVVVDSGTPIIAYIRRDAAPTRVSQAYLNVLRLAYAHYGFDQRILDRAALEAPRSISGFGGLGQFSSRNVRMLPPGLSASVETKARYGHSKQCVVQFRWPGGQHREPVQAESGADDSDVVRRAWMRARGSILQRR